MSRGKKPVLFKHPISGRLETARSWSKILKISATTFYKRVKKYGKDDARVFSYDKYHALKKEKVYKKVFHSPCGKYHGTINDLAFQLMVCRVTVSRRIKKYGEHDQRVYRIGNRKKIEETVYKITGTESEICKMLGVGRRAFYNRIKQYCEVVK